MVTVQSCGHGHAYGEYICGDADGDGSMVICDMMMMMRMMILLATA